jgi:hypothetical protein
MAERWLGFGEGDLKEELGASPLEAGLATWGRKALGLDHGDHVGRGVARVGAWERRLQRGRCGNRRGEMGGHVVVEIEAHDRPTWSPEIATEAA